MFADNPDFYPTPRAVARRMLAKITNQDAKYFLEPSAGKGDIADVIRRPCTFEEYEAENSREASESIHDYHGAWRWSDKDLRDIHVDVIESYPDLAAVLRGKNYDVVGFDWLTYGGVSYYDAVIMNPPFSQGAAHLLKAWDFLHHGEIVCLLNEETIKNPHTFERQQLARIIAQHGSVEFWGDCFSTAERKSSVNVACVYLKKEAIDDAPDMWANEAKAKPEKEYTVDYDGDVCMLAIRDNLANMEHWFNMANEHWAKGIEHIRKAKLYMDQNKVQDFSSRSEDDFAHILKMALANVHTCRAEFLRRHRKQAWTSVFQQMEFNRWLDSKQQERFMRDVERDSVIPFTAENIRGTLENVFLSRKKLFDESVANVFDELCSHAVENGEGPVMPSCLKSHWKRGEGWKTNDNYKVNQKLIFPYGVHYNSKWGDFDCYSSGDSGRLYSDLDRILCVLDGRPFDKCYTVGDALSRACSMAKGRSGGGFIFESEYFEGRFFKKGTVHLKWKRLDLWERFNVTAAAGKKWLGENTQQYRPTKRRDGSEAEHWECRDAHTFVDGKCKRCGEPEIDEIEAAADCEYCRAIFEHTGRVHCPIHEEMIPSLPAPEMSLSAGD